VIRYTDWNNLGYPTPYECHLSKNDTGKSEERNEKVNEKGNEERNKNDKNKEKGNKIRIQ
jgi:hypothetical protein